MSIYLLPEPLEAYVECYTSAELPVLAALNEETHSTERRSNMLSGHVQGAFLQMISHMVRPRRILEIGTFTGYSAICLAQGLTDDGLLHTLELDETLKDIAAKYIIQAGLNHKIIQHIGNAAELIPPMQETFDLVFIDANKSGYEQYYDLVWDKVPVGGYILADNVLFKGDVISPPDQQSKAAKAMDNFNKKVQADDRVQHMLLSLRDGIMLIRKLRN